MKVNRITGKVKELFYISTSSELDREVISPKVPINFFTKNKISDWKVKRVCFYPSIDQALSSMYPQDLTGMELYVYSPLGIRNESLIKPGITEVPEAWITDEYWYLVPIELRLKGIIKVNGKKGTGMDFRYGPRQTLGKLFKWDWKEKLNPWEKEKLK